ncbi:YveK family protein [Paenibacillus alkalitolerans]|uniref:YveK family protein n=1 Tax=Paenibacillus alkalitolerans TaxID=2799335 RepID=UPI0018F6ABAC|nr:Wzz/FepE/Etk N-terminal domain-containing protein [Paenibacillus alkalitolerans]
MELRRYWNIVGKKLWLTALITLISCTAAGFYSQQFSVPEYEASAKLIVNQNTSSNALNPSIDTGSITSNIMLIKTYKEIIRTPRIMGKVVEQYPELNATVNELIAKVSVSSVNETQVMSVSARDYSYERAVKMANAVSEVFQQEIRTLMNLDNVSVLYWADPSEQRGPVSPPPTRMIVIAFILAVMVGIGLSFLLDYLDDTVKTERDIRARLGLPTLAAIPKMKRRDMSGRGDHIPNTNQTGWKKNVTIDA